MCVYLYMPPIYSYISIYTQLTFMYICYENGYEEASLVENNSKKSCIIETYILFSMFNSFFLLAISQCLLFSVLSVPFCFGLISSILFNNFLISRYSLQLSIFILLYFSFSSLFVNSFVFDFFSPSFTDVALKKAFWSFAYHSNQ